MSLIHLQLDAFMLAEEIDELVGDVDFDGTGMEADGAVARTVYVEVEFGVAGVLTGQFGKVLDKFDGEAVEGHIDRDALDERVLHVGKQTDFEDGQVVDVLVAVTRLHAGSGVDGEVLLTEVLPLVPRLAEQGKLARAVEVLNLDDAIVLAFLKDSSAPFLSPDLY